MKSWQSRQAFLLLLAAASQNAEGKLRRLRKDLSDSSYDEWAMSSDAEEKTALQLDMSMSVANDDFWNVETASPTSEPSRKTTGTDDFDWATDEKELSLPELSLSKSLSMSIASVPSDDWDWAVDKTDSPTKSVTDAPTLSPMPNEVDWMWVSDAPTPNPTAKESELSLSLPELSLSASIPSSDNWTWATDAPTPNPTEHVQSTSPTDIILSMSMPELSLSTSISMPIGDDWTWIETNKTTPSPTASKESSASPTEAELSMSMPELSLSTSISMPAGDDWTWIETDEPTPSPTVSKESSASPTEAELSMSMQSSRQYQRNHLQVLPSRAFNVNARAFVEHQYVNACGDDWTWIETDEGQLPTRQYRRNHLQVPTKAELSMYQCQSFRWYQYFQCLPVTVDLDQRPTSDSQPDSIEDHLQVPPRLSFTMSNARAF
ncbi:hypothetical protein ACHAWO_000917 [Cyclotella atomus]|uniref:Uncharacterized protein n=1 Tax=Cyclotella atomus TaxID=382360 RepID=A0ABD3PX49_9STRA